jgi:hypothetical protein
MISLRIPAASAALFVISACTSSFGPLEQTSRMDGSFAVPVMHGDGGETLDITQPHDPETPLPELVVKSGQSIPIAAKRWEFSRLEIQEGGYLVVESGTGEPLHLVIKGPARIAGQLVAKRMRSGEKQLTVAVPGQPPLTLNYKENNRGGAGGNGGSTVSVQGGRGAAGSVEGGGGGGAGGGHHIDRLGQRRHPGASAQDTRGAQGGPNECGRTGGNGAERSEWADGGVIQLTVFGEFDGTGGTIDVSGLPGAPGVNGGTGSYPQLNYGCQGAAGGGGGGGPGGQGGYVVGYLAGPILGYPRVQTQGGAGGKGGASPGDMSGQVGGKGQNGASGAVFWFTPSAPTN